MSNDFTAFCESIKTLTKNEPFFCKMSTNGIKLSSSSVASYRSVIKYLQLEIADFHTYQIKQDRAFQMIIRNFHHSNLIMDSKKKLIP